MRKALGISLAAFAILLMASAGYANDRPHEGKIVSVQTVEKSADAAGETVTNTEQSMVVRGEHGDEWTLYWDNTTEFKHDIVPSELKAGDSVHFDFVEKNGKMWLTELRRTHKADRD
jgi:Cu/Ag efflux protein CusF